MNIDPQASAEIGMDCGLYRSGGCDGGNCVECSTSGLLLLGRWIVDRLVDAGFFELRHWCIGLPVNLIVLIVGWVLASTFGFSTWYVLLPLIVLAIPVILALVGLVLTLISMKFVADEEGGDYDQEVPPNVQEQMAQLKLEENIQQIKGGGMAG
jgi:hypothetical protein